MQGFFSNWFWPIIAGLALSVFILDLTRRDALSDAPGLEVASYATAVAKATPSVVNIYTLQSWSTKQPTHA
jgi:S1-C subfamily serine protease